MHLSLRKTASCTSILARLRSTIGFMENNEYVDALLLLMSPQRIINLQRSEYVGVVRQAILAMMGMMKSLSYSIPIMVRK